MRVSMSDFAGVVRCGLGGSRGGEGGGPSHLSPERVFCETGLCQRVSASFS